MLKLMTVLPVIFMLSEEYIMPIQTVKIINNVNNQLLALPKEFSFDTPEVYINKQGDHLIIGSLENV